MDKQCNKRATALSQLGCHLSNQLYGCQVIRQIDGIEQKARLGREMEQERFIHLMQGIPATGPFSPLLRSRKTAKH